MNIVDRKTVYNGFFKLYKITLEENGETFDREVFVTGNAVAALLYDTRKEKFIFVSQYRAAVEKEMLELVAGILDKEDESVEEAMKREIEEESGYVVDSLEHILDFHPSPGAFAEKLHLFYGQVSRKISAGGGLDEEHENLKLLELTKEEIRQKQFVDGKTVIAVQWAQLKGII